MPHVCVVKCHMRCHVLVTFHKRNIHSASCECNIPVQNLPFSQATSTLQS